MTEIKRIRLNSKQAGVLFEGGSSKYNKLMFSNISTYSSTLYKQARLVSNLLRSLYGNKIKKQVILDASANIGGDLVELAKLGSKLYGVEVCPIHFEYLKKNVEILVKNRNVELINDNIVKLINEIKDVTIGFFDPPWRDEFKIKKSINKEIIANNKATGAYEPLQKMSLYYEHDGKRLTMANIIRAFNLETAILKVPDIYDSDELKVINNIYNIYIYPIIESRWRSERTLYLIILLTKLRKKPDFSEIIRFRANVRDDIRLLAERK